MDCEKCGGKVDKISTDNFFCRECGARHEIKPFQRISGQGTPVQGTSGRGSSGLLNAVIILNYLFMVIFIGLGLLSFFFLYFYSLIALIPVVFLLWINLGLRKFESSKRKYSMILFALVLVYFSIGFFGVSLFISVFLFIMIAFQYYILYMHKPTVELFMKF